MSKLFENIKVYYVNRKQGILLNKILVSSKNIDISKDEYDAFNVTEAINKWNSDGVVGRLELEVAVSCPSSVTTGLYYPPSIEFATDQYLDPTYRDKSAQLVVSTIGKDAAQKLRRKERKRRQDIVLNNEYCSANQVLHCCIHDLQVRFHEDLNITKIAFPQSFSPNYCQGHCPIPSSTNTSISSLVRDYYIGDSCCTIDTMKPEPLVLIVRNDTNLNFEMVEIPNMEIESCGCVAS